MCHVFVSIYNMYVRKSVNLKLYSFVFHFHTGDQIIFYFILKIVITIVLKFIRNVSFKLQKMIKFNHQNHHHFLRKKTQLLQVYLIL